MESQSDAGSMTGETTPTGRKRRVSFSQYQVWATCPHQWRAKYVDGFREPPNIHLMFGSAVHETIQHWLDWHYNRTPSAANLLDMHSLLKERMMHHFKESTVTLPDGSEHLPADLPTLLEFYQDGTLILDYLRQKKNDLFPRSGFELVGCEIPLEIPLAENLEFVGYIDVVVRHKRTGKVTLYDLKTSKKGWYYEKKDPKKTNQLLLYKRYYSEQFNVDEDLIDVEFMILKRQVDETNEWNRRISSFAPTQGRPSVNKAVKSFAEFVASAYNPDGTIRVDNLPPTPSESSCRFCPLRNRPDLCDQCFYKE